MNEIEILDETLSICQNGSYVKDGRTVTLGLSLQQLQEARVFLPDEVHTLGEQTSGGAVGDQTAASDTTKEATGDVKVAGDSADPAPKSDREPASSSETPAHHHQCVYDCELLDSFALARKLAVHIDDGQIDNGQINAQPAAHIGGSTTARDTDATQPSATIANNPSTNAGKVLVLNLANPVNPGGGVRYGAHAQEESLCRDSSLLLSLESADAKPYYAYNQSLDTMMGSDAIIITPHVTIIRDEHHELLDKPVEVAVMTCAAPDVAYGLEGMSQEQYEDMMHTRITGMLCCAAHLGYRTLVLGAFGCGAFRNDAAVVAQLFAESLRNFTFAGHDESDAFDRIEFAVLGRHPHSYNYRNFARIFGGNTFRTQLSAVRTQPAAA